MENSKNLDVIRLSGVVALFCVALGLGGVYYELHQMRSNWNPRVSIAGLSGNAFQKPKLQIEIVEPIALKPISVEGPVDIDPRSNVFWVQSTR
jgi:hypothetical protein